MTKTKVAVVGCGKISWIYLKMLKSFAWLDVAACADLDLGRAKAKAAEFGVPRACSVQDVLADPGIGIVLNLTVPKAHAEVARAALAAGKSVYNEKPLTATRAEGEALLALAAQKKLRVGGAPDTFFGASHQTCRKLIDDGAIGVPVGATAFMLCRGHEGWHPDPEFYYEKGGGPLFDMGPYYLTALVNLLGPVKRVTGSTRISFPERTITSEPKRGKRIRVETATHCAAVLDFAQGAVATLVTSFDVCGAQVPRIEVYGSEGSLSVPDPNNFGGPIKLLRAATREWQEVPYAFGCYAENCRGVGVADLAKGLRSGRPHRVSGELTFHVLDIMSAIYEASEQERHIHLGSSCQRPAPLPLGLKDGELDD